MHQQPLGSGPRVMSDDYTTFSGPVPMSVPRSGLRPAVEYLLTYVVAWFTLLGRDNMELRPPGARSGPCLVLEYPPA